MRKILNNLKKIYRKHRYQLNFARRVYKDHKFYETYCISKDESKKNTSRTKIISFLLNLVNGENYLEIGVRNPKSNFNKIDCKNKFSVDPGIEFKENPVDFKMISDEFFSGLKEKRANFPYDTKFDVIFIDGLHLAEQVERDIANCLEIISDKGFVVVHDCNPPTEFHARESYDFKNSPAKGLWNGTTWKAFYKFRHNANFYSICFDTDWGVGVISKHKYPEFNHLKLPIQNPYFEFKSHVKNRNSNMNLQNFKNWAQKIK